MGGWLATVRHRRTILTCSLATCLALSPAHATLGTPPAEPGPQNLSPFAETPPWQRLLFANDTLTRAEFETKVREIYSPNGAFFRYWNADDAAGTLYSDLAKTRPLWEVTFLPPGSEMHRPSPLLTTAELAQQRGATLDKPLTGLTICLDPGHIGGAWANMEERYFRIGSAEPIEEASLNLTTCELLAPLLEKAGATIVWSKHEKQPVTDLRPWDLWPETVDFIARKQPRFLKETPSAKVFEMFQWNSELLFYRVTEIFARAHKVNQELKPDLTLCVHFNAAPWKRKKRPRLLDANKIVLFLHGSYTADELVFDDFKFHLLRKLFENSTPIEKGVAGSIATQVEKVWNFPAENMAGSGIAHGPAGSRYVWYRDLLANRLFDGPTVFVEGPYMNDKKIYRRLQAGDYEGTRLVNGKPVRSIFREFSEIIATGVIDFYRDHLLELSPEKASLIETTPPSATLPATHEPH